MLLRQELLRTSHKRRRWRLVYKILAGVGVVGIISAAITFLFYIPSLRVKTIAISGLDSASEKELRLEIFEALGARRLWVLPKDHLIFFPRKEIEALLADKFRVKQFQLEKNFPSSLKIAITARETWAIWCSLQNPKNCLLLDKEGLAFEKAPEIAGSIVLKIIDARGGDFLGKNILPPAEFQKILFLIENVTKRAGENVLTADIKASGETYLLHLKSGWYLILDNETDQERAVENLVLALNSEIKENRANLEYIDLRFPDKVFYKYK